MAYNYSNVSLMMVSYPYIGSLTTVTSANMAMCVRDAEAVINAKLGDLYTVPVAGSPPVLETIATTMAVYDILIKFMTTAGSIKDHPWHKKYENMLIMLDKLASGDMTLINSAGTTIDGDSSSPQVWSNTMNYQPTFADGLSVVQAHVDPDKIDDEEGARDL